MEYEAKKQLIDRYLEAYNGMDIEGMIYVLHEDIVFRNIADGVENSSARGHQAFRQLAERSAGLFVSRRQIPGHLVMHGGRVEAHINYEAVLAQDLPDGLRAGDTLRLQGRTVFGFREGAISEIEDHS
ncbi:nuclear transport factor 2 family protein [Paenibacillus filicis]|uniref:Nuclear transport factor 2 family protein n=1 Tax=Paenibacillus filicis TaxID=669464 RepID=A0ABU9DTY1_9BACL